MLIKQFFNDNNEPSYAKADDGSELNFGRLKPDKIPLKHCRQFSMGEGATTLVDPAELEFRRAAKCGIRPSPEAQTRWSSNTIHSLYVWRRLYSSPVEIVIASQSGLGARLYCLDILDLAKSFLPLVDTMSDAQFWDLCSTFVAAYERGFSEGSAKLRDEFTQAYLDGRIQKVRGKRAVRLKPAT